MIKPLYISTFVFRNSCQSLFRHSKSVYCVKYLPCLSPRYKSPHVYSMHICINRMKDTIEKLCHPYKRQIYDVKNKYIHLL